MSQGHDSYLATTHFAGLDGLRCLAILPVIAHHATARPPQGFWAKGAVGVDLFFVLSGFLITTLLLREKRKRGTIALGRFYWRRSLRIFPLYYAVLGFYVGAALLFPKGTPQQAHLISNAVYHATYTANWFVNYDVPHSVPFSYSWSLCVEEQFYLFWPLLVLLVPRNWALAGVLAGLFVADLELTQGWLGLVPGSTSFRILTSFSTAIASGAFLAIALDARWGFSVLARPLTHKLAAPLALLAVVLVLLQPATPYLWLCFFLALLVGAVAVRDDSGLGWFVNHSWAAWGGKLSYAAYLTHISALIVVRALFPRLTESFWFTFLVGLPVVTGLAALAHFGIERPVLRWRDRAPARAAGEGTA